MILAQTAYSDAGIHPTDAAFEAVGTLPGGVFGPAVYSCADPMARFSE
jgi:hypothetical protein